MIITAQLFFNELDLLEINCHNLRGVVDAHVIVEARTTFTGKHKPLWFAENKSRFREFKIIHKVIDLDPAAENPWHREGESHKKLNEFVKEVNPEIVIWSDADELTRPECVDLFRGLGSEVATLEMDHLIYYFDRIRPDIRDQNGKIAYFIPGRANQPWRGETNWPIIYEAGWHFEYMGERPHLMAKLGATSHALEEGAVSMRAAVQAGERPGLQLTTPYPRDKLPAYVLDNHNKFKSYFSPQ